MCDTLSSALALATLGAQRSPFPAGRARALGWDVLRRLRARIMIYAIAATSLNLLLGYGGMVSFGHAAFLGAGAYAVGDPDGRGRIERVASPGRRGGARGAVFALVIGAISLRTRGVYFIMITLAFAQMIYYLFISHAGATAATTG